MTWIKICGTTNLEDALMSVEAGANALGFVFYENSPRNVSRELVREIVNQLPAETEKIGVVPDFSALEFRAIADQCGLTGVQVHAPFQISGSTGTAVGMGNASFKKIYLSFCASDLIENAPGIPVDIGSFGDQPTGSSDANVFGAIFLDSGTSRMHGGTGKTFDWQAAAPLVEAARGKVKIVVAGGLNPKNVAEAIRILDPWGVDVVSGVEASPGKKDPHKVRDFIAAVRQTEKA